MEEIDRALGRLFGDGPHAAPAVPSAPSMPRPRWGASQAVLESCRGALNALWDDLASREKSKLAPVVLFTGTTRASGRSTLVLALALAAAERSGRTGLIDADLQRPSLSRWLRIEGDGEDWVTSLRAGRAPEGIVPGRGLAAWTLGRPYPDEDAPAILRSPAWKRGLARLRSSCDLVLIDGGPLHAGRTAPLLPASISGAILVARSKASGGAESEVAGFLGRQGISLWGRAETFAPAAA